MTGAEPQTVEVEQLRREAAGYDWFHTIDLGNGKVTKGRDSSPRKLDWVKPPA